ncbi:hypothetical protein LHN13_003664 [Acinetobacter baumannii]|nr:hypothetical protein [Acinetobacter baumannii]EKV1723837.1 hypothetical protein [Acinetobacter baumannii]
MKDKSKWFVFKKNDQVFGCFRLKPFTDPEFDKAYKMLCTKKSIFRMSEVKVAHEFTKIIATHLIQDWENIELSPTGVAGEKETRYSPQNAYQLLMLGDIGPEIATWILEKSKSIA